MNINLAGLPPHLQDYVLLHELVHTRHKNHGRLFWKELNALTPDAKSLSRELKKYKLLSI